MKELMSSVRSMFEAHPLCELEVLTMLLQSMNIYICVEFVNLALSTISMERFVHVQYCTK